MENNQKYAFKIWWDEKEGILREKPSGEIDEACAKSMVEELLRAANARPGKILVLTDMSEGGSASSRARKIFAKELKNEKYAKHAFFGFTIFTKVLVSFIARSAGVKNVGYFATEREALKWLKSAS
ncbi:MAG: STAS/SEC14 domain-containing protein [Patescibacteria group bacterium]|nr:STAS/SEC14 domain-containing protein [Patescibacteria group bacterium]